MGKIDYDLWLMDSLTHKYFISQMHNEVEEIGYINEQLKDNFASIYGKFQFNRYMLGIKTSAKELKKISESNAHHEDETKLSLSNYRENRLQLKFFYIKTSFPSYVEIFGL